MRFLCRGAHGEGREREWSAKGAELAHALELRVNAGHGINYKNIGQILELPFVETLNIGTRLSRAVMTRFGRGGPRDGKSGKQ